MANELIRLLFAYFLIFVAPGIIVCSYLSKDRFNIADKVFLAPVLGASCSVLFGSLLSLTGIRITERLVIIAYVGLLIPIAVICFRNVRSAMAERGRIFGHVSTANLRDGIRENWHYLVLAFLVALGIIAKVAPGLQAIVPPLHDPSAHAIWAKSILDTGYITYFYSSGLHLLTVFSTMLSGVEIPKHLIYITNFFNAYVGVGFFLLILKVFKDRFWAVIAAAMFTFGYYPTLFYTTAGKNTLVVAIAVLPIAMLFTWYATLQKDKFLVFENGVIPSLLLACLFLVHYPSIYIYLAFVAAVVALNVIGSPKSIITRVFYSHILGGAVICAWAFHIYKYYISEARFVFDAVTGAGAPLALPLGEQVSAVVSGIWTAILVFDKSPYHILLTVFAVGFLWLVIARKKARFAALWFAIYIAGIFLIDFFKLGAAASIRETALLEFFVFTIIGASALFALTVAMIKGKPELPIKTAVVLAVMVLAVFMTGRIYREYTATQRVVMVVAEADLNAMKWIDRNIPKGDIILNRAVMSNGFLFGTDAGYWIPVFTRDAVEFSFLSQKDKDAFKVYEIYAKLTKDPGSETLIDDLRKRGIEYIYFGSKSPYGNALRWEKLPAEDYKQIYKSAGVRIYEFRP